MDDFCPRQVLDCCDVALSKHFHVANFDPNAVTTRLDDSNRKLEKLVGCLLPSGTCFVLSKATQEIRVKGKRVEALAATNFHAAYSMYTREKNSLMWAGFSENREELKAIDILFEFNTRYTDPMFSEITHEEFCHPSDLAVIVIYDRNSNNELIQVEIAEEHEIAVGMKVFISGHPCTTNYYYVLPDKKQEDDDKIKSGFHDFKVQVNSAGTLLNQSESGLLEMELSATAGMSGSPILIGEWPNCKIAGIYCGGPPLAGQRLVTRAIQALVEKRIQEAIGICSNLPFMNKEMYEQDSVFISIMTHSAYLEDAIGKRSYIETIEATEDFDEKEKQEFQEQKSIEIEIMNEKIEHGVQSLTNSLADSLYKSIEKIKNKDMLTFNVGISVKSECFQKLKQIIKVFDRMGSQEFPDCGSFSTVLLGDRPNYLIS